MAYGLVFAALATSSQTWGADLPAVTCGSVRENTTLELRCPAGQVVKEITFASYGTPSGTCAARNLKLSACHSPHSQEFVKAHCMGKASCALKVASNGATLPNPCAGVMKMLAASVACAKPGS